ncbi:MAG: hypothetical protein IPG75_20630 [Gemmatimonadetes bacterium]|nr:hypothetical protein [Gemmatimonadota bacterium]
MDEVLTWAGERLQATEVLARELDGRVASLSTMQERLNGFEARLAEWRGRGQQLAQATRRQASVRQATIGALQGEIRALFEVAERTQADARAVVEAHPQLARTRAELDGLLERLGDAGGMLRTLPRSAAGSWTAPRRRLAPPRPW